MNVVLDTNVFVSGVFFSGPPYQILKAWRDDKIQLVISLEIFDEYQRVGRALSRKFQGLDLEPILDLLIVKADLAVASSLPELVCEDPDDDKFLACAIASKTKLIISGDKHLLRVSGYQGIEVVRPRQFVDEYIPNITKNSYR